MYQDDKRKLRELKRQIKQAGSQRRRRSWKRQLADDPEGAPDAPEDFGRYRSALLNGIDRDAAPREDGARED